MNRRLQKIDYLGGGILLGIIVTVFVFYGKGFDFEGSVTLPQNVDVCFTPPQGCLSKITQKIDKAKTSILIQAYSFTSKDIERALLRAHKRGVSIDVIVDRGQKTAKGSIIHSLAQAGIRVSLDSINGIAHNKVMILDQETVITGSFNFSNAANTRNAENLLIIKDKPLAALYEDNWKKRKEKSLPCG